MVYLVRIIYFNTFHTNNFKKKKKKKKKKNEKKGESTIEEKNIIFRESIEFGKNEQNISILKKASSFIEMEPSYFFPLNSKSRDQITDLFFKNLQLSLIQNSFQNFKNIVHLDLSRNNLTQLPIQISNFFFFFFFSLTSNLFTFREIIGNLTNLINLNLSSNKFEIFPLKIENLTSLTRLNFSFNNISTIPNQIGNSFLFKLFFHFNKSTCFFSFFSSINCRKTYKVRNIKWII